jgi:mono/diheme cytochrome c family protein
LQAGNRINELSGSTENMKDMIGVIGFVHDINSYLLLIAILLLVPIGFMSKNFIECAKHCHSKKINPEKFNALLPLCFLAAQPLDSLPWIPGNRALTILLAGVIMAELSLLFFLIQKTYRLSRPSGWSEAPQRPGPFTIFQNRILLGSSLILLVIVLGASSYHQKQQIRLDEEKKMREDTIMEIYLKPILNPINESNVPLLKDADIEAGKKIFKTTCSLCHKSNGGGLVGPNLCDDYWLHGDSLKDIFKTIKYGYPAKGMQSWQGQLSSLEIAQVANYVLTLRGTNPEGPKAKQGVFCGKK